MLKRLGNGALFFIRLYYVNINIIDIVICYLLRVLKQSKYSIQFTFYTLIIELPGFYSCAVSFLSYSVLETKNIIDEKWA